MRHIQALKKHKSQNASSQKYLRIHLLVFFILGIVGFITYKLFVLQVIRHDQYVAQAENQHSRTASLEANRGEIYLQDESDLYPIAVNRQMQMLFAVPREMKNREEVIEKLKGITGLEEEFLKNKLKDPEDVFEILKHRLSDIEVDQIRSEKIPGVYLRSETFRYYPGGELASQLVGFVGSNGSENRGMYGLEAFWENQLKGKDGVIEQEGDASGRWIPIADRSVQKAENGVDLVLTINHTVQYEVEKILQEGLEQFDAEKGSIIVVEPKTGKILAMVSLPNFNPNEYSKAEDISLFANPAVSAVYEPGSTFKTFTEAAGIDDGKISPNTTYVDTGLVNEAGYDIQNSDKKAHGVQTMTQVLENSLNTGVIYIEKLLGNAKFADYVKKFGFGQKTGVEIPGEVSGSIANLSNLKRNINFYTIAFGQGISATPMQVVMGYAALANDGILMKPQIIDKKIFSDSHEEVIDPQEVRRVVSSSTAQQMGEMLRSVVVKGHGKRADVPGYLIGGKTGTAQIPKIGGKGYEEGMNIGSFAGYGPLNDPRFAIIVELYNPKNVEWAESSAAPTFGRVMKFLLEYYKIKPTEDPVTSPLAKMPALSSLNSQTESVSAENQAQHETKNIQEKQKNKR